MSYDLLTAKKYCVVTFNSTQSALMGEKHLTEKDIELIVIPTPREISADCGLALKIYCPDLDMVREELAAASIRAGGFYRFEKTDYGIKVMEVGAQT